jgi:FeS assembly SUF system protein
MADNPQPVRLNLEKLAPHQKSEVSDQRSETNTAGPADDAANSSPEDLKEKVIAVLHTCYDPELPVNIYELGLVYDVDVNAAGAVGIRMTLTSPGCPVAGSLVQEVQGKIKAIAGVTSAQVDLVWDPPWDKSRMSDAAKLQLGIFDY